MNKEDVKAEILKMGKTLQEKINIDFGSKFPNLLIPKVSITFGRKYAKVIRGTSVHSFVDITTGDIYKAASYQSPAKHIRGSIWEADQGYLSAWSTYGANYR